ncbi:hypothetical protein B0J17DRAFT_773045 [Rhizoctonia solani]|nr:hypothetical protein B0J17DRAFT_773045 [Rhizoctonia solani]
MPRPSKGTRASRENLLKARAKRTTLRLLCTGSGSGDVPQRIKPVKVEYDVYLNSTVVESDDQARPALRNDHAVTVSSKPGPELDGDTEELNYMPKLPDENGAIIEENETHSGEKSLYCDKSTSRPADQGVALEGPLVEINGTRDCEDVLGPVPKDGVRQHTPSNEKNEAVQPMENRGKSYLKMYKENYRAFKKMKLAVPLSATNGDLERADGTVSC